MTINRKTTQTAVAGDELAPSVVGDGVLKHYGKNGLVSFADVHADISEFDYSIYGWNGYRWIVLASGTVATDGSPSYAFTVSDIGAYSSFTSRVTSITTTGGSTLSREEILSSQ